MALIAFTGLMRSGKSYGVVENVIIPALKEGRTVVTNIPLKVGYLTDDYPEGRIVQFQRDDPLNDPTYWNLDNHPHGAVFVIDEAWRYWKAGTKATQIPEHEQAFFTEHGHVVGDDGRTNEIVLVTQDLNQVCAFVRDLVDQTYRSCKLNNLGQSKKFRVDIYNKPAKGANPGVPDNQMFGTYKPEIFKYYVTNTRNKTSYTSGMEQAVDNRGNILKSPLIKFGMPVSILLFLFCLYKSVSFFMAGDELGVPVGDPDQNEMLKNGGGERVLNNDGSFEVLEELPSGAVNEEQLKWDIEPNYLEYSDTWRIVGTINNDVMLWSESGERVIHKSFCSEFETAEMFCVIRGELVTWFSSDIPEQEEEQGLITNDLAGTF